MNPYIIVNNWSLMRGKLFQFTYARFHRVINLHIIALKKLSLLYRWFILLPNVAEGFGNKFHNLVTAILWQDTIQYTCMHSYKLNKTMEDDMTNKFNVQTLGDQLKWDKWVCSSTFGLLVEALSNFDITLYSFKKGTFLFFGKQIPII